MKRAPAATGRMWVLRSAAIAEADALTFRMLPGHEKTVGRGPRADFVVDAPLVSRVHCRLTAHPAGSLELKDLKSTNGTLVNGRRVGRATLKVGDRLTIGRVDFTVGRE